METAEKLVDRLADRDFSPGDVLPPHSEWAKEFNVSSFTVSRAFGLLKTRGIISAAQGSYTRLLKTPSRLLLHQEEKQTVVLEQWQSKATDPQKIPGILLRRSFNNAFGKKHPGIEVRIRLLDHDADGGEAAAIQSMLYDRAPSFMNLEYTSLRLLAAGGALAPVNDSVCGASLKQFRDEVLEACAVGGDLYLYPTSQTYSMLCARSAAIERYGLSLPGPGLDLPEWIDELCRKSRKHSPAFWTIRGYALAYWLFHLIHERKRQSGEDTDSLDWDSAAVGQAIELFVKMINEGALEIAPSQSAASLGFLRGDVPYLFSPPEPLVFEMIRSEMVRDLRLFPVPGVNREGFSLSNIGGFVVNSRLNPMEREAAWRYVDQFVKWAHQRESASDATVPGMRRSPTFYRLRKSPKSEREREELPQDLRTDLKRVRECGEFEPVGTHWLCESLSKVLEDALKRIPKPIEANDLQGWLQFSLQEMKHINPYL